MSLIVFTVCAPGCATSTDGDSPVVDAGTAVPPEESPSGAPRSAELAIEAKRTGELAQAPLGLMARQIGALYGGGIVVMHGTNPYTLVGPYTLQDETMDRVVRSMAAALPSCVATLSNGYYFLHPPEPLYESLNAMSLEGKLHPRYRTMTAAATFGVDTPLFNAFALLGHSLDITIVGDNAVTDGLTGELAVGELPLHDALAAVLKSARISDQVFRIESTDEYIFIRHVNNAAKASLLANAGRLSAAQEARLDRRVDVALPAPMKSVNEVASMPGAQALGYVLDELSGQLGIEVRTEPGIEKLPVNPVVMNGVRVRTAMDLLIRQWPLAQFAYELTGDVIVIRYVGPQ
jgi:hypothetical protein